MPVGDALPEIAVLVAAIAALLAATALPQRRQAWCAPLALLGLLVAAMLCAWQLGAPARSSFAGAWAIDGASIWARLIVIAATALCVPLVSGWLREERRHGEFYAMLLLSALGAMLMAGASDTLELVLGVLLSSITGYTLAAWHRDWALSVEAGMKYFLVGALANALLLIGAALLFGFAASTRYEAIAQWAAHASTTPLAALALALIVIGLAFKMGAAPAHAWLPDVAEGAPAPAAAFLTVVPKIGAAIALSRLLALFPTDRMHWPLLVAALSVATMTLGNLSALWQDDVRRMLGWSSVSQSGYALMAVAVLDRTAQALPALLFFLAGYAAANVALFAAVTQLRGRTRLDDYRGLARARPWIASALALGMLSLVGIPPLAGFVGKLLLFEATIDAGLAWLAVAALLNTVASLFYYLRVIAAMYLDEGGFEAQTLGGAAGAALSIGSILVIALGIGAEPLLASLGRATLLRRTVIYSAAASQRAPAGIASVLQSVAATIATRPAQATASTQWNQMLPGTSATPTAASTSTRRSRRGRRRAHMLGEREVDEKLRLLRIRPHCASTPTPSAAPDAPAWERCGRPGRRQRGRRSFQGVRASSCRDAPW